VLFAGVGARTCERARIVELASEYGRYGYRRITGILQDEGWHPALREQARGADLAPGGLKVLQK